MKPSLLDVGQDDRLLPAGIHELTAEEVKQLLVDPFPHSETRADIYVRWLAFRSRLADLVSIDQEFVDGSFVTSRQNPRDIDVSYWVDATELDSLSAIQWDSLRQHVNSAKGSFLVHAFVLPRCGESHPAWPQFDHMRKWTRKYWKAYSDSGKNVIPGVSKGYIKVASS